ncbi:MAG: PEP-CTERM sorting domain-containing protein [Planctomycetota bacterium]
MNINKKFVGVLGGATLATTSAAGEVITSDDVLTLDLTSENFVAYDFNDDGRDDIKLTFLDAPLSLIGQDSIFFATPDPTRSPDGIAVDDTASNLAQIFSVGETLDFSGTFQVSLYRAIADLSGSEPAPSVSMGSGIFGMQFSLGDGSTGLAELVLAQFSLAFDPQLDQVLVSNFAYESTPGVALQIIPEPTSLATLAIGAAGLLAARRRED